MSAYALPGLFPPIDTASGEEKLESGRSCSGESRDNDDSSGSNSDSKENNRPLHQQDGNNDNYTSSIYWSGTDVDDAQKHLGCLLSSAAIAVKEAKVDPVRWIQFVTGSNPQQYAKQIGRTLRRRVYGGNASPQVSPVGRKPTISKGFANLGGSNGSKNSKSNNNRSPQNEAIEFELAITLNGRRYTATRTMQCILQLRDDLIREMTRRKNWLTETEVRQQRHENTLQSGAYFHSRNDASRKNVREESRENKNSVSVQIPEIPPLNGSDDRNNSFGDSGFVGKGFTMLHAMVTSYVPAMESWFKNVMEVVPKDSECLINFLWEPSNEAESISCKSVLESMNNTNFNTGAPKKFKSSTSLATLGSIKEMECSTDEDSDDENDHFSMEGW